MSPVPGAAVRVAAIDCGTNTIRLLVADVYPDGRLSDVLRRSRIVRLGEGVDRTGLLSAAALERTRVALVDYTEQLRALGASRVRMAATSATRDAANRDEFVTMVTEVLGQPPEVLSGVAEAQLSFRGALTDLDPARGPFLVTDIGGGSTELVVGSAPAAGPPQVSGAVSENVGSVRLTERLLHSDPPTADQVSAAEHLVQQTLVPALDRLPGVASVRTLVAVSGTATSVAAGALGQHSYDERAVDGAWITATQIDVVTEDLLRSTTEQRLSWGYLNPGRADVIGGGAIIMRCLMHLMADRAGLDGLVVSEHDILDGLAASLVSVS